MDRTRYSRPVSSPADDAADLAARLERIKRLTERLVQTQSDSAEARAVAARIEREVDAARATLNIPKP